MMSVLYILEEAAANSLAFRFDLRSEMSVWPWSHRRFILALYNRSSDLVSFAIYLVLLALRVFIVLVAQTFMFMLTACM